MIKLIVTSLLLLLFVACIPASELYLGKTVSPEDMIRFDAMSGEKIVWETFDLIMTYNYSLQNNVLDISGTGELSQHYQLMYTKIRNLRVYLFLLDENDTIIKTVLLPSNWMGPEDRFTFQIKVITTEKISALSFGYSGSAYDMDSRSYFYQLPYEQK